VPDEFFNTRFHWRQRRIRAQRERTVTQFGIERTKPGRCLQSIANGFSNQLQGPQIRPQLVVFQLMLRRVRCHCCQPDIKRGIRFPEWKDRQRLGQAKRLSVEACLGHTFCLRAEPPQKTEAVARDFFGDRANVNTVAPAQSPEKHSKPPANLCEVDRGSMMHLRCIQAACKCVPQFPDRFFGFPWLEVDPAHRSGLTQTRP